jgi:N utilization substance protein B
MAIPKQKFREIVLLLLYSHDMTAEENKDAVSMVMETLSVTKKAVMEAYERVNHVLSRLPEIDKLIEATALSYAFDRIQRIEKNVVRLGIYEMLFDDEVPPKVAIAEAMRLARKFSTPEAASFVNALLDTLYKKQEGIVVDGPILEKEIQNLEASEKIAEEASKADKEQKESDA